jgi:hypothetical protein
MEIIACADIAGDISKEVSTANRANYAVSRFGCIVLVPLSDTKSHRALCRLAGIQLQ